MYFAILQRWDGEKTDSLCMEYPFDKKEECLRMLEHLKRDAYQKKTPVTYRITELDGEMEYEGKKLQKWREDNGVNRIIIQGGNIREDIPLHIQKDIKGE